MTTHDSSHRVRLRLDLRVDIVGGGRSRGIRGAPLHGRWSLVRRCLRRETDVHSWYTCTFHRIPKHSHVGRRRLGLPPFARPHSGRRRRHLRAHSVGVSTLAAALGLGRCLRFWHVPSMQESPLEFRSGRECRNSGPKRTGRARQPFSRMEICAWRSVWPRSRLSPLVRSCASPQSQCRRHGWKPVGIDTSPDTCMGWPSPLSCERTFVKPMRWSVMPDVAVLGALKIKDGETVVRGRKKS